MMRICESYIDKLRELRDKAYDLADGMRKDSPTYYRYIGMAEAYDDAFNWFRQYAEFDEPKPDHDPYNSDKYRDDEVQQRIMEEDD